MNLDTHMPKENQKTTSNLCIKIVWEENNSPTHAGISGSAVPGIFTEEETSEETITSRTHTGNSTENSSSLLTGLRLDVKKDSGYGSQGVLGLETLRVNLTTYA